MGVIDSMQPNVLTTTYDAVFNWARRSAIWPMQFGLACCAIEMMVFLVILLVGYAYAWRRGALEWA